MIKTYDHRALGTRLLQDFLQTIFMNMPFAMIIAKGMCNLRVWKDLYPML